MRGQGHIAELRLFDSPPVNRFLIYVDEVKLLSGKLEGE
jgi:hypothetical protein